MKKNTEETGVSVEVEFTDGYQERFTIAIMKIYEKRLRCANQARDDNKSA